MYFFGSWSSVLYRNQLNVLHVVSRLFSTPGSGFRVQRRRASGNTVFMKLRIVPWSKLKQGGEEEELPHLEGVKIEEGCHVASTVHKYVTVVLSTLTSSRLTLHSRQCSEG
ncbi:hypothetical protein PM082_004244 [Marasmius tenuissimus]|nr:hypothetical protein PM082_004244 [Marasmius tenuissimus]